MFVPIQPVVLVALSTIAFQTSCVHSFVQPSSQTSLALYGHQYNLQNANFGLQYSGKSHNKNTRNPNPHPFHLHLHQSGNNEEGTEYVGKIRQSSNRPIKAKTTNSKLNASVVNNTTFRNDNFKPKTNLNANTNANTSTKRKHQTHSDIDSINSSKITIFTILMATTLNLLGFTLTSPLNPTLGKHFQLPTGASFGSLTSAYPLGMLLGQITWPRLSDLLGRKKILAVGLMGSGVGLGLQSLAVSREWSLGVFLATRVFTGMFSGSAPVAKAFLADIGDRDQHLHQDQDNDDGDQGSKVNGKGNGLVAKYLGWRDAAATLSYIIGPALGGILYEAVRCFRKNVGAVSSQASISTPIRWLNLGRPLGGGGSATAAATAAAEITNGVTGALAFVIGVAALGSLIASFMVMSLVKDIAPVDKFNATSKSRDENDSQDVDVESKMEAAAKRDLEIMTCPLGKSLWTGIATVCTISFLYHIADSTFFAFFPALLQNQLGFNAKSIGMSFTGFAFVSFLFSATSLSSKLIERVGVVNACAAGLATIGAGLLGLSTSASSSLVGIGIAQTFLTFGAGAMYFAGVPLYGPTIPTMLLLCVPPYQRGTVMGVDGVINTIGRIVSPLIMGDIYRRFGATATFGLASGAVFTSSAIALIRRFIVRKEQRKLAST